ncbi:caspase family protein [Nocardia sp. BMG111209]|uniref:caspase family protein n=1 Tax=Nocardia sp. BMG111209 TaxID=1160137 RepID=UPI00039E6E21|nr:caspase family protein [Nocardia sp. BMG111209]
MARRSDIDFAKSRAILVGTSHFTAGFGYKPVPAAARSLAAMRATLRGPGGWPRSRITRLRDNSCVGTGFQQIVTLIHDTTDVLIFYYVGHGQPLPGHDLGLAYTDTSEDPKKRLSTSLCLRDLREEIQHNCSARIKILILDCCCSGIAAAYGQGTDTASRVQRAAELTGEGTYTWTACGHGEDTFFESAPGGLTYFTKFLTETARGAVAPATLTVTDIHHRMLERFAHTEIPEAPVKPEPRLRFEGAPPDTFAFVRPRPRRRAVVLAGSVAAVVIAAVVVLVVHLGSGRTVPSFSHAEQISLPFTDVDALGGVAVDGRGTVYAIDTGRVSIGEAGHGSGRVLRLAPGAISSTASSFADAETGDLLREGLAVDAGGDIFVIDSRNHRVLRQAAGSTTFAALPFTLTKPGGVAVDARGDVYVTDTTADRVLRLAVGGTAPTDVSVSGLTAPTGIAVDPAGDIYVIDSKQNRLMRLTAGSSTPTTVPGLTRIAPDSVAVDAAGDVFVTGYGQLLRVLAGAATAATLPFSGAAAAVAVAVNAAGNTLYVTESGQVWRFEADR